MMDAVAMRPRYMRAAVPPPMHFQQRDGEILTALDRYDGVLAKRHVKLLFWPGASWRAMEMRLSLLYHQGYLDWPTVAQWRTRPIPEPVCWLGWKGAVWLAGRSGLDIQPPRTVNEAQLRRLNNRLREQGRRWLREPRWSQLRHDLTVVDVRLAIERAVGELPYLTLEDWMLESAFRAAPDEVEYTITLGNGKRLHKKRGIVPDGYFVIEDERRKQQGLPARTRFLLEVDMGTHDTNSFFQEKVLAGSAYMQSEAYRVRFGGHASRWLVVTTREERLQHLMSITAQASTSTVFLFTTLADVLKMNVLTAPMWRFPNDSGATALIATPTHTKKDG